MAFGRVILVLNGHEKGRLPLYLLVQKVRHTHVRSPEKPFKCSDLCKADNVTQKFNPGWEILKWSEQKSILMTSVGLWVKAPSPHESSTECVVMPGTTKL